jgi:two-component system, response regulator PdtaR
VIILVVEDEAVTATHLQGSLADAGYEVLGPAPTASSALELAEQKRPDLALIDMDLQDGSNGIDLARMMKRRWNTPALVITGFPDRARANRDVAVGLIAKPYRPETVLASIKVVNAVRSGESFSPMEIPPDLELF